MLYTTRGGGGYDALWPLGEGPNPQAGTVHRASLYSRPKSVLITGVKSHSSALLGHILTALSYHLEL